MNSDINLRHWSFGKTVWQLGDFPRLMGIVNVTPDSFSDGGRWVSVAAAVEHALELVEQGADVLDIGGESTRPNAEPVTAEEELRRVVPVIEALSRQTTTPISIDTTKADVAQAALAAGASIVNDVSGLTFDPQMASVCAASDCGVILMHMQGTPQTMQLNPTYTNAVTEIRDYLNARCDALVAAGIARERLMVDPGIGFGKTAAHNVEILSHISQFRAAGRPVLIGHSRKGFLQKLVGRKVDERQAGTIGVSIALAAQHTDMLRVHDVGAVRDALVAWRTIMEAAHQSE
ncbi:dihydropteroate synthase [Planctomicrobium piriforme]|uniref:Dihydropteroate synthase n=1 Tax=Planctomicrobium piriforme TaxID=1576369 RepID=A0A1I3HI60_9PLAN|nr:dihydropteroate synthase [Planctomicrobium piriforme]SFI35425.1 dihydropteroate synthase [Planctomicrobium piriforme]